MVYRVVSLRPYTQIDEASKIFMDPVVLSRILLHQKIIIANKREKLVNALRSIIEKSTEAVKNNSILYTVIKSIEKSWVFRAVLAGKIVVSIIYEEGTGHQEGGGIAYNRLVKEVYPNNPMIRYSIGTLLIDDLPDPLKDHIHKSISEKLKDKPPHIWLNKLVYDIYLEKIITDKGSYMYVLLGRDKFEHRYAIKIPREKSVDGKPLAVGSTGNALSELLSGLLNSLEISVLTKDDIKKLLTLEGYDSSLAEQLIHYRKYILRPRAIIMLRDTYSQEEYVEAPPMIIEEYANLGDLDTKIRKKPLNNRELLFVALRIAGALALTHLSHLVHMDVKPQNILLREDEKEPYGYAPLLSDYVGLQHLYDHLVELKKSTPEYADPISLIRGKTSYSYDVYSLGTTLYYAATGRKLYSRILVNLMTMKYIYGSPVPLRVFLLDNPELVQYAKKMELMYKEYISKKKTINTTIFIEQILKLIEDYDRKQLEELKKTINTRIAKVIMKSLSLDENTRYRSAVDFWKDLVRVTRELGYTNLLPS